LAVKDFDVNRTVNMRKFNVTSESAGVSRYFPTRIKIIYGSHCLYNVATKVTLFSLLRIIFFYENNVNHVKTRYKLWLPGIIF
jgi:hypothetical protein